MLIFQDRTDRKRSMLSKTATIAVMTELHANLSLCFLSSIGGKSIHDNHSRGSKVRERPEKKDRLLWFIPLQI